MEKAAGELISLIREMVREELNKRDSTVLCVVEEANNNGTINAYLATDMSNLITGILNPNNIICQKGDLVLLYKVNNQIPNSFIIMNYTNRTKKANRGFSP